MKSVLQKIRSLFTFENVLLAAGALGLYSAVMLTIEKFHLLENPGATLGCDLNPIIACGSVINTSQASAFGFPNPIIGIVGFSVVLTIGMALKAGAKFRRWFWQGLQVGTIFGVLFVHWLMYQSIFVIEALCPYCMVVWAVTIALFVYVTRYNVAAEHIPKASGKIFQYLRAIEVVLLWYALVAGVILIAFWYYWQTVAPFSWIA